MEAADPKSIVDAPMTVAGTTIDDAVVAGPQQQLSELFGSYKAEWLKERLFDLFTEPTYFPELTTSRPCVLVGGRGTGKTTVLKCLSYEGKFALSKKDAASIPDWPYYGLYYRVNTNRVTAFEGEDLDERQWQRLFAHYMNLLLCSAGLRFLTWYSIRVPDAQQLSSEACASVSASLNLPSCETARELTSQLDVARLAFEAYINNVADDVPPPLSMQGAPIDALFEAIASLPHFHGKEFFFLVDEYENFLDYQQQIVNTLIKHSGQLYTFKIGVRELGWRKRATLNETELLISPADYVLVDISQKLDDDAFGAFAKRVCNARVAQLKGLVEVPHDIVKLLPGLSDEEEAIKLGVTDTTVAIREALIKQSRDSNLRVDDLSELELYFLEYRSEIESLTLSAALVELRSTSGRDRYENYKHALLFRIRHGKRGIRKYYAGWDTFLLLAARNIRYLIELVDQSLLAHLNEGGKLDIAISVEVQTRVAQAVGRKNLGELEGLSVEGAKLTKLLLGLGRVFQVMAADMAGHAPEVNQFRLVSELDARYVPIGTVPHAVEVAPLMTAAVMHLALLRTPGNKLGAPSETQEDDYMVHPVFSPFFVFSHRRKRKMSLTGHQVVGLVAKPKETIKEILSRSNRVESDEPLPDQLALFEPYYAGSA